MINIHPSWNIVNSYLILLLEKVYDKKKDTYCINELQRTSWGDFRHYKITMHQKYFVQLCIKKIRTKVFSHQMLCFFKIILKSRIDWWKVTLRKFPLNELHTTFIENWKNSKKLMQTKLKEAYQILVYLIIQRFLYAV